MPARQLVVFAFAALTAVAFASEVRADPAALRERAAKLMGEGTQRELPGVKPLPASPPTKKDSTRSISLPGGVSSLAELALYVILAAGVVLGGLFLWRELGSGERAARLVSVPAETADERAALLAGPAADAAELARGGRFGEAIHSLLLRTLEQLVRRAERPIPSSLTSREVLAEVGLHGESHAALAHLISAVEISFFGGAEPSEADYQACVERFHGFAAAFRGQA